MIVTPAEKTDVLPTKIGRTPNEASASRISSEIR